MAGGIVFVADGSKEVRDRLRQALAEAKLGSYLVACPDGRSLLASFARAAGRGHRPRAVVLDVKLPVIGGKSASIALRSIEKAFRLEPTPILFYSEVPRDAGLERVLSYLRNARYVAREGDPASSALLAALREVLTP